MLVFGACENAWAFIMDTGTSALLERMKKFVFFSPRSTVTAPDNAARAAI